MTGSVSLDFAGAYEETTLESAPTLDRFLASVERRAFRIAQMAVRDRDEALDIVQGAMLRLARGYARRPSEEWKPLFYRILYNGIRDFQRRRSVRSRIFGLLPGQWPDDEDAPADPFEQVASDMPEPSRQLMADEAMQKRIGERVQTGDVLAQISRGVFGEVLQVKSPVDGTIEFVSRAYGRLLIREAPKSALPIAVLVNIIRLTATAVLASIYGGEVAQGFLHDFAGLMRFAVEKKLISEDQ